MTDLASRSLAELAQDVASGRVSCTDVVVACIERIERTEPVIGALLDVRREAALAQAEAADRERASGATDRPLAGLPIVVKANLVHPDLESNCASRILEGFRAPYAATVLERLADAGMIVLATANMDEFAMGSSCENSGLARTGNPWDPARVPGGSSGGSAASVAARQVPVALGSDTGGSIRQPAALCGVTGLKPTYGRVSRYGLVAFASSLDQIGPLARSAEDAALVLRVIAGHDRRDSTSLDVPVPDYVASLGRDVSGLRIGVPHEYFEAEGVHPEVVAAVTAAIEAYERLGAKRVEVDMPHTRYGVAAYYLVSTAEASSNLMRYDGVKYGLRAEAGDLRQMYRATRSKGFGAEVKRRILLGTFVLSEGYHDKYYTKAQRVRTLIRRDFERAFETCDVLATPTVPSPAWPIGERVDDPLEMYLSDVFTVPVNLAGLPAISLPCGMSSAGLPLGLQLIGRPLAEESILSAAHAYQRETEWHRATPDLRAHPSHLSQESHE